MCCIEDAKRTTAQQVDQLKMYIRKCTQTLKVSYHSEGGFLWLKFISDIYAKISCNALYLRSN